MSVTIVWEFMVGDGREAEFERAYGPDGDWAQLFRQSKDYLGTDLLRDTAKPGRYLTVDRWKSAAAYEYFHRSHEVEYGALDARCEALTARETKLGMFQSL